ncbi:MAG: hypothetical protein JW700_01075 [Candidatus Aenigmarchaeota archaeon]|nr:hypothetical protein [Candidatus Aenigmarchaeota archaeon]
MKGSLILVGCMLVSVCVAYAASIDVGVSEIVDGRLIAFSTEGSNLVKFSSEFYNTGSVPYKARAKIEIQDNNQKTIFSGWSLEEEFYPGDKKVLDIYWHTLNPGVYLSKLKIYFGNEVSEYKNVEFVVENKTQQEDVFSIRNFRTYDDYVLFDVIANADVQDIVIMPTDYMSGWIFEQKVIDKIKTNSSKYVMIRYVPSLWATSSVKLLIASDNGKYYTEETIEMKKLDGLVGLYFFVTDSIKYAIFN